MNPENIEAIHDLSEESLLFYLTSSKDDHTISRKDARAEILRRLSAARQTKSLFATVFTLASKHHEAVQLYFLAEKKAAEDEEAGRVVDGKNLQRIFNNLDTAHKNLGSELERIIRSTAHNYQMALAETATEMAEESHADLFSKTRIVPPNKAK